MKLAEKDVRAVQQLVCDETDITLPMMNSYDKTHRYLLPRQIAMYLCKVYLKASYPEIAKAFNRESHHPVMDAHRKIQKLRQVDQSFNEFVDRLEKKLVEKHGPPINTSIDRLIRGYQ